MVIHYNSPGKSRTVLSLALFYDEAGGVRVVTGGHTAGLEDASGSLLGRSLHRIIPLSLLVARHRVIKP